MAGTDIKIKDAPLVSAVSGGIKIPVSDGTNYAKSINVAQIKEYANEGMATKYDVINAVDTHDTSTTAHPDIRDTIVSKIETHNTSSTAHSDIRGFISAMKDYNGDGIINSIGDVSSFLDGYSETDKLSDVIKNELHTYFSYGVEINTSTSSTTLTRIGNATLHKTLPVQSMMRGCLLNDNGEVVKYLDPNDWTSEDRSGASGQVMVEIPEHYRKFETEGNKLRTWLSMLPLPTFRKVPKMYVSAYEASIERSTGKLCSVVNEDVDYRGGNNNADYDGTYRSFLGRPATSTTRINFTAAARKRNPDNTYWNNYLYQAHKTIYWLYTVEYANLNSQAGFNAEPTTEGYHQGGLGAGVTNLNSNLWGSFNGYSPFIPCGYTDSLGNGTGIVPYTMPEEYAPDSTAPVITNVPRYRGIENIFGHIHKWLEGINLRISATEENGGDNTSTAYVCNDPSSFSATGYDNYTEVGAIPRKNGYISQIIFGDDGDIIPLSVNGSSSTYFCDYFYTSIPSSGTSIRALYVGGSANAGTPAGLACAASTNAPSSAYTYIGSRLCFSHEIA